MIVSDRQKFKFCLLYKFNSELLSRMTLGLMSLHPFLGPVTVLLPPVETSLLSYFLNLCLRFILDFFKNYVQAKLSIGFDASPGDQMGE